jgi:hypothetical protein
LLAQVNEQLSEIAGLMPRAEPDMQRPLKQIAREARRTRLKIRFVGWMLHLLDTR